MSPVVRQTYTNISLVAMIPAVVWAMAANSAHNLAQVVGGFPFYYLVVCQVMILPRYAFGAVLVEKLSKRYKRFSIWGGMIGLLVAGVVIDIVLTVWFASVIADASHAKPFMIPLVFLPVGFVVMLLVAVAAGFAVRRDKPVPVPTGRTRKHK
jgi:hypothetical protein